MVAVIERADARVRHGFELADRGASYTARSEFIAALQLIAQANDAQQSTRLYTKALTAGLTALRESSDFVRQNASKPEMELPRILSGHKTPVLKDRPLGSLTPVQAAQFYYNYAQEQLAAAANREPTGSMALFGLAKIAILPARQNRARNLESSARQ